MTRHAMQRRQAVTMIEIAFAVLIAGLAIVPMIDLLSKSNLESTASIYEVMATNYATELAEQLLDLSYNPTQPRLKQLELDAGRPITDILTSKNAALSDTSVTRPRAVKLDHCGVHLLVSPLDPVFLRREIVVMPYSPPFDIASGSAYLARIILEWRLPNEPAAVAAHLHEAVVVLRKDP